jgi:hypothetical protein
MDDMSNWGLKKHVIAESDIFQVGETLKLHNSKAAIRVHVDWTFPLNYIEIISGDGSQVYRERIDLRETASFGNREFTFNTDLKGRKWVRLECWDVAANGAFTQQVWLE